MGDPDKRVAIEARHREAAWPHAPGIYKADPNPRVKARWMSGIYDEAAPIIRAFAEFEATLAGPPQSGKDDPARETLENLLNQELSGSYDCKRVWEAWGVGTMGEDDFSPVAERIPEIVEAILALPGIVKAPETTAHWTSPLGGVQEARGVLQRARRDLLAMRDRDTHLTGVYEPILAALEPALAELAVLSDPEGPLADRNR